MQKDLEQLEQKLEKKVQARERKKKPKMKVSGKGVLRLKEILRNKFIKA